MTAQTLPIHPLVISRGMVHHCWTKVGYTIKVDGLLTLHHFGAAASVTPISLSLSQNCTVTVAPPHGQVQRRRR